MSISAAAPALRLADPDIFVDGAPHEALAELRRTLWRQRISPASGGAPLDAQTVKIMVEALAVAA